ncbi:MAG: 2'-5' RNA ligase family protein [Treponema sp.]|nr:2'-5' RNA ligase family protein [Treponema sp.]
MIKTVQNLSGEFIPPPESGSKKIMRSVLLFPHFHDTVELDQVRSMFDSAYTKIQPHITLVFPFSSFYSAAKVRTEVISAATGIAPFNITLTDVVVKDSFLFMLPSEGKESVKALFHALYTGLFRPFLPSVLEQEEFIPHMTIGTCSSETAQGRLSAAKAVLGKYSALIDTVTVEIIGDNSESIIESEIPLHKY